MSKKWFVLASMGAAVLVASAFASTAAGKPAAGQRGTARSSWASPRSAPRAAGAPPTPSRSRTSAKAAGIELKFSDAQQKQENQIKAIRTYIQQKVDVIAFSPVVSPAGTPCSRRPRTPRSRSSSPTARSTRRTPRSTRPSSARTSSRRARRPASGWSRSTRARPTPVNIVELQGTTGSAPANDRKKGFARRRSRPTRSSRSSPRRPATSPGPRARRSWRPSSRPTRRSTCCSRTTTTWASARSRRSRRPARSPARTSRSSRSTRSRTACRRLADGKINFIVECSPLLGPQLMDLAKKVKAGETVPTRIVTEETTFTQEQAKAALPTRKY